MGFFGRAFYSHEQRVVGKSKYNVHLPRTVLRRILYEAVLRHPTDIAICWYKQLQSMTMEDNGWKLLFNDQHEVKCDLVIGADGIFSSVRDHVLPPALYPQYGLNYLGCVVVLGIIEWDDALVVDRIWQTMDGTTVFIFIHFHSEYVLNHV